MAYGNFIQRTKPGITKAQSGFCVFYSKIRTRGSNELKLGTKLPRVVMNYHENFGADPARRLGSTRFDATCVRMAI